MIKYAVIAALMVVTVVQCHSIKKTNIQPWNIISKRGMNPSQNVPMEILMFFNCEDLRPEPYNTLSDDIMDALEEGNRDALCNEHACDLAHVEAFMDAAHSLHCLNTITTYNWELADCDNTDGEFIWLPVELGTNPEEHCGDMEKSAAIGCHVLAEAKKRDCDLESVGFGIMMLNYAICGEDAAIPQSLPCMPDLWGSASYSSGDYSSDDYSSDDYSSGSSSGSSS
ncbi:unnamed protein product [Owenia fusiformis]|uniref:Uncharacterized protein n=1 Tax=Owenia fusiformis TaxID=6347 RepID=A0A8J1XGX4_OWEFU|nr:unnamed protein product [Owenia fusiformis]